MLGEETRGSEDLRGEKLRLFEEQLIFIICLLWARQCAKPFYSRLRETRDSSGVLLLSAPHRGES